ncbi:MAG: MFS transporter [Paracoccaceae bacterium]
MRLGFYRTNAPWLAAAFLATFASSFGQTFFIALFAGGIRADFGLSDGQWGGLYTAATLGSAAVLVQAGGLVDRLALRPLILGTTLLYLVAILAVSQGGTVWLLGLGVFGLRLAGQGMMSHIGQTAVARWFRANRGRAIAVAVLGYPAGEALLPPLAVLAIGAFGWRGGWLAAGAVLALVLVPAILAVITAFGRRRPSGEGEAVEAPGMDGRHWTRGEALGHWSFWALMPGVLAPGFIGTVVFFHQVHVAELRGWDLAVMAAGYPAYAALSVATSLVAGSVIDRVGPVRLLPVYLLPLAGAILLLAIDGSEAVWVATLLGIGVSQGVVVTLMTALWPELYGTRHLGGVKALATSATVVATAVGPGLTGALIDLGYALPEQAPAMALWCLAASGLFAMLAPRLSARLAPTGAA